MPVPLGDLRKGVEGCPTHSPVEPDEDDEENLTSVMPSNQDERDLVRDRTRAVLKAFEMGQI